ncbi:hypothetical protein K2173_009051 [Erythroxylum novogranatense]|uniref:Uncharacterized protein n=1 Tax=Erythroxylum novogranatense TaxID=1862640 RepID=A0AAV8TV78_9ROSI|nr:hypothetical protein K2173_009051 [Erythroxylum novogranatense]
MGLETKCNDAVSLLFSLKVVGWDLKPTAAMHYRCYFFGKTLITCTVTRTLLRYLGIHRFFVASWFGRADLQQGVIIVAASQKLKHFVPLSFAIMTYGTAAMLLVIVWKSHIGILSIITVLRQCRITFSRLNFQMESQ